ncbi:hypothetical protein ACQR5V_07080 [Xanthomonas oryzae pv. oryzicola]|uniref:hypothetical protein n=1 Tax=Xanthomonas oryzae TaxID=347 RepID=UPI003CCFE4C7
MAAKDIALLARQDTVDHQASQSSKSSGFSVGVTYDPGASYRSARDSTTRNMVDTGSTMSKISRNAEGAAAGTMAAITPVVIDVPPSLSSTLVWSPIPYPEEIGREEAFFRRTDHRLPARSRGRHADQGPVPAAWLQ